MNAATQWHLGVIYESIQVLEAVRNCKEYIAKYLSMDFRLPKRTKNSFAMGYCPELDVSLAFVSDETVYSQFLVGVVRWDVKIGHIDIITKMFLISSYLVILRQGHMEAALHIIGYLKLMHNSR